MALRKYLRNAWVANIDQYEFERIVTVSFRTKTGLLKLVVTFREGNIIQQTKKYNYHALAYKMRDAIFSTTLFYSFHLQAAKILQSNPK
jgi:predicted ribosome quality control (RQC) complex YloA/Tae2 family protein